MSYVWSLTRVKKRISEIFRFCIGILINALELMISVGFSKSLFRAEEATNPTPSASEFWITYVMFMH